MVARTREYKVGEGKFHVFSVQNSKNELFLIVFGKNYDCSIQLAAKVPGHLAVYGVKWPFSRGRGR